MVLEKEYNQMYSSDKDMTFKINFNEAPIDRYEFAILHAGKGEKVCDIGMGDGDVLYNLQDNFKKFYGVELSDTRINFAKNICKNMDYEFFNIGFDTDIDASISDIDTVICLDVLDHIIDVRKALENIFNCLKECGKLILTVPNIARINNRIKLICGQFPSTSTPNEGVTKLGNSNLFDGGKLHYFTFKSLSDLIYETGFSRVEKYAVGKRQKLYNIYPELFSGSIALVCYK